jgi:hypothetical protein
MDVARGAGMSLISALRERTDDWVISIGEGKLLAEFGLDVRGVTAAAQGAVDVCKLQLEPHLERRRHIDFCNRNADPRCNARAASLSLPCLR